MEKRKAGNDIYSPKGVNIPKRLHLLQNILRIKIIAMNKAPRIINPQYPYKPANIFTCSLNIIYLLNTQIKHPTLHNSHPNQVTLAFMVQLLLNQTQPITLYKVRARVNIDGNEKADKLAKEGLDSAHKIAIQPFEYAHAIPYYHQEDI